MTFAIAAAGTGGHVFPALAVAESLIESGVPKSEIVFFGGDRLEATVFPEEGFPFVKLELRSLGRGLYLRNLAIPRIVLRAARTARTELEARGARAVLGMGSYVTVPVAWAARRAGIPVFLHEQNASAGLANRLMGRYATNTFVSFDNTEGLSGAITTGNPVRAGLARFSRSALRHAAMHRYGLTPGPVTVGIFGGSLGAGVINAAVEDLAVSRGDLGLQLLHITGRQQEAEMRRRSEYAAVPWIILGFEEEMQYFYAACDLVVARAGGAVAELAATGTPAVLIPGRFGGGHQQANARRFAEAGAAVVVDEATITELGGVLADLVGDPRRRLAMAQACLTLAHPKAAATIAGFLEEAHG